MALSILNNISALTAQNQLSLTQAGLNKALTQLSSGSKINSGADDAAGLSLANGLQANIAALTQSAQNSTNGVGLLQTADGAFAQVTSLLNRAVTLATEASNGGLTPTQTAAIQGEYSKILSQIDEIGQTTNFNGNNVFGGQDLTTWTGAATTVAGTDKPAAGGKVTIYDATTGGTFVYNFDGNKTVANMNTAIAAAATDGTLSATVTGTVTAGNQEVISSNAGAENLTVTVSGTNEFGQMNPGASGASNNASVYLSDGTGSGSQSISTTIHALSAGALGLGTNDLSTSTAAAQTELHLINTAIGTVASWRGGVGAGINQLNAATNIMNTQTQNLTTAESGVTDADVAQTVANMTKYNVLESTGMAALQQANQASQAVLKLLQ